MKAAANASTDVHVVMGVSACGKSTVGRLLAQARGATYLDGDDFHPPENVARMAAGQALTDADRQGWLIALSARLAQASAAGEGVVLSCSALKRRYRDVLRQGAPELMLVFLQGSRELLATRIAARTDHYMPSSLLDSQLATLEAPRADESALAFDVVLTPQQIVDGILQTKASAMPEFRTVVLYTDGAGRARFREEPMTLDEGTPQARLATSCATARWAFAAASIAPARRSGCSFFRGAWRSACRTAARASSNPGSTSIRPTRCPQAPASTPRCMVTGAASSVTRPW
jgi:gluconokinase